MKFEKKRFGDATTNAHIAKIIGKRYHHREYAWVSGEKEYTHITGGIVLPTFSAPGFLLTVGVRKEDNHFELLEEFESLSDSKLINKARDIQKEYGNGVITNFWGDPEKLMSLVNKNNIDTGQSVFISSPPDFHNKDSFQTYVISLHTSLRMGNKVLHLGKCSKLRNNLNGFVPLGARPEDHPSINLAGWLVHTLNIYRPWEKAVESVELLPTLDQDFYAYEHEKAIKDLENHIYGID